MSECVRAYLSVWCSLSLSQVAVAGLFWGRNCWWRAVNIRDYVLKEWSFNVKQVSDSRFRACVCVCVCVREGVYECVCT